VVVAQSAAAELIADIPLEEGDEENTRSAQVDRLLLKTMADKSPKAQSIRRQAVPQLRDQRVEDNAFHLALGANNCMAIEKCDAYSIKIRWLNIDRLLANTSEI
jgi:hypothetical protein